MHNKSVSLPPPRLCYVSPPPQTVCFCFNSILKQNNRLLSAQVTPGLAIQTLPPSPSPPPPSIHSLYPPPPFSLSPLPSFFPFLSLPCPIPSPLPSLFPLPFPPLSHSFFPTLPFRAPYPTPFPLPSPTLPHSSFPPLPCPIPSSLRYKLSSWVIRSFANTTAQASNFPHFHHPFYYSLHFLLLSSTFTMSR